MKIEEIKKVVVIGAGTMGQQICAQCAVSGFHVALYDIGEDVLEKAMGRIRRLLSGFARSDKIEKKDIDGAMDRISCTTDVAEAAADADIVSESVPEDPALKEKVFSRFNAACPDRTVFTTNTSTLLPSVFAQGSGRPDRLLALHFHDVRTTQIVDVMVHPGTSGESLELVVGFAERIGQIPIILKKESPGYVFNHMLTALLRAAQTLAANGVTSIQEVDRSWMGVFHAPMGPFGIMDSIGIDTVWKVTKYWADQDRDAQGEKNARFLKTFVDNGTLGQKTGKGFYAYPNPAFRDSGFIKGEG